MAAAQKVLRPRRFEAPVRALNTIVMYYGSREDEDSFRAQALGMLFMVRSHGKHHDAEGVLVEHDGEFEVRDVVGKEFTGDDKNDREVAVDLTASKVKVLDSERIVRSLLQTYEARGIVALTGNPAADEQLRREATATWIAWRRTAARKIVAQHYSRNEKFKGHPGLAGFIEEMGPLQVSAQRFLEDLASGQYAGYTTTKRRFALTCRELDGACARGENDAEAFRRHLHIAHKLDPKAIAERYGKDLAAVEAAAPEAPAPAPKPAAATREKPEQKKPEQKAGRQPARRR